MKSQDRYDSLIKYYAELSGLTGYAWIRLKAQIAAESAFDPVAISQVGARGLAQFMPSTWEEWRDGTPGIQELAKEKTALLLDPRNPEANIRAQCTYMSWLLGRFDQDWDKAFAAYNWGIGNLKNRLAAVPGANWKISIPLETTNYLSRINSYYLAYCHNIVKTGGGRVE